MKNLKRILCCFAAAAALLSFSSCSDDNENPETPSITDNYVGTFVGTISLTVADQFTYDTDIAVTLTASDDETISVTLPSYSLSGTMMGDLTLGTVTITDLKYNEDKGGFYRSYGGEGLTQHFKAEQNGIVVNDKDFPLNDPSSILVTLGDNGKIIIENPFKLGAMPLSLTSRFEGTK